MPESLSSMEWEPTALAKYNRMVERIPVFHRNIAEQVVRDKAQINAQTRQARQVQEQDILKAFFSGVPKAFYSMMIRLFEEVGFDYRPYEPPHHNGA